MYEDDENTLEFWDIELDHSPYRMARGVLYEKPTPTTVKARIQFRRLEVMPDYFKKHDQIRLSATCANKKRMRGIIADVVDITKHSDGAMTLELLLYRKTSRLVF